MSGRHFFAVWEFQVKAECVVEFERVYGRDGSWAQLFQQSSDYRGTELVRDLERTGRYLTIDRWTSREALGEFKRRFAAEYAALDKTCERLMEAERLLGEFEATG